MPRLFVAIDLSDAVKRSLEPLARGLGDVRWMTEDQLHLTLRFIGEVDNGGANEVADALSLVPGVPFELRLKGIGHFPPRGEPRKWRPEGPVPGAARLQAGMAVGRPALVS